MMLRKRIALLQFALVGLCLTSGQIAARSIAQTLPLSDNLIAFNSPQGEELFLESRARQDFWNLSSQFVTQVNQAYCGVASMVMILNSIGIPAPIAPQYDPYHVFTQENFFDNEAARQVIAPEVVQRQGLTLDELGQLLQSYSVKSTVYHAGDTSLEDFRRLAIANLNEPQNYILINYLRREIGQERGGHISPIAAYHAETDRFLILDVARYKYPPVWVKADDLWRSMNTMDSTSGKTRGFVLVSKE
ncbi:phytochelatin synthase family protein [Leptolyngbya ohadii]|uniref:phytochelatin synthase family protein n=1 Tax=Leptolyngbya ohadii TaxID=1962290 RepID=UPI001CEDD33B|nr:phytochelatin synthase family protein [Leptolyngbya ohadii]